MANIMGGISCPNNHLSIRGIKYQGVIIFLIFFFNSDLFESFKSNLFNFYYLFQHYKISMIFRPIRKYWLSRKFFNMNFQNKIKKEFFVLAFI